MKKSKLPYADYVFNPAWGCTQCSMACDHCRARHVAVRKWRIKCFGKGKQRKFFADMHWDDPVKLNITAGLKKFTPRVLCSEMCDIFDPEWPDYIRPKLWELIEKTPRLYWLLLTHRIENAEEMLPERWLKNGFPMNVGMGATIEHQKYVEERFDALCKLPAHFRWIAAEPLLSELKIKLNKSIHWIVMGCDSRSEDPWPTEMDWIRNLLHECKRNSILAYVKHVSFIYKQCVLCLRDMAEWPEDVRVQQIPNFRMIKIGR